MENSYLFMYPNYIILRHVFHYLISSSYVFKSTCLMSCISLEGGTDFENDALIRCIMGNVGCSILWGLPQAGI